LSLPLSWGSLLLIIKLLLLLLLEELLILLDLRLIVENEGEIEFTCAAGWARPLVND
jgi:hypothetical protein